MPETGGAATFVRRAFNDPLGLPDRLGALPRLPDRDRARGALRAALPRQRGRLGRAHDEPDLGRSSSASASSCVMAARPARAPAEPVPARDRHRRHRRSSRSCSSSCSACRSSSPSTPEQGHRPRHGADAGPRSRSRSRVAMLAYTGLETVANLAAETREPGRDAAAEPLRRHRRRGRRVVPDRPGRRSPRIPRDPETQLGDHAGCARRSSASPTRSRAPARRSRRRPARLRRADRRR